MKDILLINVVFKELSNEMFGNLIWMKFENFSDEMKKIDARKSHKNLVNKRC